MWKHNLTIRAKDNIYVLNNRIIVWSWFKILGSWIRAKEKGKIILIFNQDMVLKPSLFCYLRSIYLFEDTAAIIYMQEIVGSKSISAI